MLPFSKYQGLGNDFLLLDARSLDVAEELGRLLDADRIRRLCDRRFGIGADGVILALPPERQGDLRMRIFNADGSEPEMCGNGIRCLARFLADSDGDAPGRRWTVETLAGPIVPELLTDGTIRVDMGQPLLTPEAVPTTLSPGGNGVPEGDLEVLGHHFAVAAAGMGNPHVVIPVTDVAEIDLERFGPAFETHPAFPARTNVHFVQVLGPDHLLMRVWERGAGPTLACGTGACATLVVCHSLGLCEARARLDLPGGTLEVHWDRQSDHLLMSGPAEAVFDGVLAPSLWPTVGVAEAAGVAPEPLAAPAVDPQARFSPADDQPANAAPAPGPVRSQIDCSVVCAQGCIRPDDCASAAARAQVEALLANRSLDELVALATQSIEARARARGTADDSARS
ncbi:MAG: diaminopimelate epimerase [Synechococcaceae cyanobacterium]